MIGIATGASRLAVLAMFVLLAAPASAQILPVPEDPGIEGPDADEAAAMVALSTTPVGALPPLFDLPGIAGYSGRMQFHAQFGFLEQEGPFSVRNYGFGLSLPSTSATVRLSAGIADFVCDDDGIFGGEAGISFDCGMGFFAGADVIMPLIRPVRAGTSPSGFGANLVVSLGGSTNDYAEIDFEDPFDPALSGSIDLAMTNFSAAIGVPFAFVARSEDVLVIPHVTPRIGYGRSTMEADIDISGFDQQEKETAGGFRPMLGAGVDILFGKSGFGLGFGLQKVFAEDSDMLVGVNLSFRPR